MAVRPLPDLEPEALGKPRLAGSLLLHIGIVATVIVWAFVANHFHGSEWGNQQAPGAIDATLVSSAPAIPLPQDQPPTQNVVATETPSQAPAPPQPKEAPVPPPDAIPIAKKEAPKRQPKKEAQPERKTAPAPPQQYRANYGEEAANNMPRTVAPTQGPQNPVSVTGGSEGFNYGYYIAIIQSKVRQNWYTQEVDPSTPVGSKTIITFSIARDGTASNFRILQSSGFPTLDSSAMRAVQRVENFSSLPPGYSKSSLYVEYTFTYEH